MPYTHNEDDPPTVLIVEDDPGLANLFTLWLEDAYVVKVANNCAAAAELLDETIDIALLDRNLPDGPGEELLTVIHDRELECRVAMVTAVQPTVDIIEMGFDEYLCKPVAKEELREMVEQLLTYADFDEALSESYTMASKLAMLETHYSADELADNEDYAALQARFDEIQAELTAESGSFPERKHLWESAKFSGSSD